jgi:ABC-type transporter Mla MlaB component
MVVFRLDTEYDSRQIRLSISGEISAEGIEMIEARCDQALRDGNTVEVVLLAVTAIDDAGAALLRRLSAKGVGLSANGLYNSHLVESIRHAANATHDRF